MRSLQEVKFNDVSQCNNTLWKDMNYFVLKSHSSRRLGEAGQWIADGCIALIPKPEELLVAQYAIGPFMFFGPNHILCCVVVAIPTSCYHQSPYSLVDDLASSFLVAAS
jgi:hypothetical protein